MILFSNVTHLSIIKYYEQQANIDINPKTHDSCNLEIIITCKTLSKWEMVMFLLCWELMWGCDSNECLPLQCKLCMNIKNIYFGKSGFFLGCSCKMVVVLTSTVQFNVLTKCDFRGILSIDVVQNMGQSTYSKSNVASMLWFVHFGMRIDGVAKLLSCSCLINHTSIMPIFHVNLIAQRSFLRDKTRHFLVHHFLQLL